MKNILIPMTLMLTGLNTSAQITDEESIVGTWQLDIVDIEEFDIEMSDEEAELLEEMKSLVFMTFRSDSTVVIPDFESEYDGEGDVSTTVSKYYLKEGELFIVLGDDTLGYKFISDNYLQLMDEGESMFFRKE